MTLVRVTVAGTIGKAVRINTDATIGSQIGVDFQLPDGTTPTLEELADALYVAAPPGEFVSDTEPSSGPQIFETQIVDGLLLARVADNEVITGAYTFNANVTMSNGIPINWKSQTGAKVQFLNLSAGAGVAGEVGHARIASATSQQTTSGTYVNFTAGVIPHASLENNEDYLVFVRGVTSNLTSQSTPLNGARLTYNGVEVANSEMLYESKNGATNDNGHPYQWSGIVNSGTVGDLQLQFKSGNAGVDTVDMGFVTMLMIKVSDLTLNTNIFFDSDTGLVELDDGNFPPTSPFDLGVSVTIGDDASDYLVFGCVGIGDFTTGGNTVTVELLANGGSGKKLGEYVRADNSDEIPMGLVGFYEAPATGTVLTLTGIGTGFPVDKKYAFLAAIRMNAFAEVHKKYVASGPVLSGFPGDTDIATINVTTTLASNNWCFFGSVTEDWAGSAQSEHTLIRANIGGAGDVTQAGDPVWGLISDGTDRKVSRFMVSDDVVIGASVTIDADLQIGHPTTAASDILTETILLAFTWELKTNDEFDVGDSAFLTTIHGTRVDIATSLRILDSTGNDSVTVSHDGTDFNVVGINTADINITGITSIQAGTVDADFDAITATSYGAILEANLLDKSAAETITESWIWSGSADTITFTGGGPFGIQFRSVQSTTAQQIDLLYRTSPDTLAFERTSDAVKIIEINASTLGVDFAGAITAASYDGVLAANLLDKSATETISGFYTFSNQSSVIGNVIASNLLDKAATENISGRYIFSNINGVAVANATPLYELDETDIGSNGGRWRLVSVAGKLRLIALSDDGLSSNDILTVDRTGTTVDKLNLLGTTVDVVNALTATSYDGILAANLVDKSAPEIIAGAWEHTGKLITAAGTVALPSQHFTGDPDTGSYSPGANIYAITVGGVEAVRWTGASIPVMDLALESGITASTTQTQGQQPLTASYNVVSIVANDNDVVTLPVCTKGRLCLVINRGAKKLQLFPALGVGLGQGLNSSTTIEPNSSLFFVGINPTNWHETASDKTYRVGHTYGVISKIKVPSGQKDFIIPFFVSLASGQTAKLVKARHKINAGTSVTCKLQKNDVDITGFTGISVTTTADDTDPADVTLADNDKLALIVTAISGNPENMSFTIFLEYTT